MNTLDKDSAEDNGEDRALIEIYKRLRPGEPALVDNARTLLESMFFDQEDMTLQGLEDTKLTKAFTCCKNNWKGSGR